MFEPCSVVPQKFEGAAFSSQFGHWSHGSTRSSSIWQQKQPKHPLPIWVESKNKLQNSTQKQKFIKHVFTLQFSNDDTNLKLIMKQDVHTYLNPLWKFFYESHHHLFSTSYLFVKVVFVLLHSNILCILQMGHFLDCSISRPLSFGKHQWNSSLYGSYGAVWRRTNHTVAE